MEDPGISSRSASPPHDELGAERVAGQPRKSWSTPWATAPDRCFSWTSGVVKSRFFSTTPFGPQLERKGGER